MEVDAPKLLLIRLSFGGVSGSHLARKRYTRGFFQLGALEKTLPSRRCRASQAAAKVSGAE